MEENQVHLKQKWRAKSIRCDFCVPSSTENEVAVALCYRIKSPRRHDIGFLIFSPTSVCLSLSFPLTKLKTPKIRNLVQSLPRAYLKMIFLCFRKSDPESKNCLVPVIFAVLFNFAIFLYFVALLPLPWESVHYDYYCVFEIKPRKNLAHLLKNNELLRKTWTFNALWV